MVFTDEDVTQIKSVFDGIYENKQTIKDLNGANTDAMKGLTDSLYGRTGEDPKIIRKVLDKSYKEYVEVIEAKPDTISEAIVLLNKLEVGK